MSFYDEYFQICCDWIDVGFRKFLKLTPYMICYARIAICRDDLPAENWKKNLREIYRWQAGQLSFECFYGDDVPDGIWDSVSSFWDVLGDKTKLIPKKPEMSVVLMIIEELERCKKIQLQNINRFYGISDPVHLLYISEVLRGRHNDWVKI